MKTSNESTRPLTACINRNLAHQGQVLRKSRSDSRSLTTLGDYYIVDIQRNVILHTYVDPETIARELEI